MRHFWNRNPLLPGIDVALIAVAMLLATQTNLSPRLPGVQIQVNIESMDLSPNHLQQQDPCPRFVAVDSPGFGLFNGVAGLPSGDIWAVGDIANDLPNMRIQPLIQRRDGSKWIVQLSPYITDHDSSLQAVAAVSPNDVWAVGFYSDRLTQTQRALLEHWNGFVWDQRESPKISSFGEFLQAVAAVSTNDVWAVGAYGNGSPYNDQALIEHWDGSRWNVQPSPSIGMSNKLQAVAAVSPNDVWAVGSVSVLGNSQTLIEHWDGSNWTRVPSPNIEASDGSSDNIIASLNGAYAISSTDVWAVGSYIVPGSTYRTLIEHWDGSNWTRVPSPSIEAYDSFLYGVSGLSSSNIWAVGYYASTESSDPESPKLWTLILHWDGTTWSVLPSANPGTVGNTLVSISAVSSGDVWAVGRSRYSRAAGPPLIEQFEPCPPTPTPTRISTSMPASPTPEPTSLPTSTPGSISSPTPTIDNGGSDILSKLWFLADLVVVVTSAKICSILLRGLMHRQNQIEPEDRKRLVEILAGLGSFNDEPRDRRLMIIDAGLRRFADNIKWNGDSTQVARRVLDRIENWGLLEEMKGYTALGALTKYICELKATKRADAEFLAKFIVHNCLVLNKSDIAKLIQDFPGAGPAVDCSQSNESNDGAHSWVILCAVILITILVLIAISWQPITAAFASFFGDVTPTPTTASLPSATKTSSPVETKTSVPTDTRMSMVTLSPTAPAYTWHAEPFVPKNAYNVLFINNDLNGDGQEELVVAWFEPTLEKDGSLSNLCGSAHVAIITYDRSRGVWNESYQDNGRSTCVSSLATFKTLTFGTKPGSLVVWAAKEDGTGGFLDLIVTEWNGNEVNVLLNETYSHGMVYTDNKKRQLVTFQIEYSNSDPSCCPSGCRIRTYSWQSGEFIMIDDQPQFPCEFQPTVTD